MVTQDSISQTLSNATSGTITQKPKINPSLLDKIENTNSALKENSSDEDSDEDMKKAKQASFAARHRSISRQARLACLFFCEYDKIMIVYDEAKRQANLAKHGLDLADAGLVYDAPNKITLCSPRQGESRLMDVAMVEIVGIVLVLVYVERDQDIRAISLRRASKLERKHYASLQQD